MELAKKATIILRDLQVPVALIGYNMLRDAVIICTNDVAAKDSIIKGLYA